MRWKQEDIPGALAAWAVALCALLVVVNPAPLLRAALAVLTPVVVLLAFLANLQQGSCPFCRASRRHQRRHVAETTVRSASRAATSRAGVGVITGWEVEVPVVYTCTRCSRERCVTSTHFLNREHATTAAEAELIARRDTH